MTINKDEDKQLRKAYRNQFKANANCLYYFCDSEGYKLLGIADSEFLNDAIASIRIDDIKFELPHLGIRLLAYQGGTFIPLVCAYKQGKITRDAIAFIAEFSYDNMCKYNVDSEGDTLEF